jgi:CHAT domain-containing protein
MLKFVRFCTVMCLALCMYQSHAQTAAITKQLDELKAQNNLEEWLYTRMDAKPKQLVFLMATQRSAWRQPANIKERIAWLTLLSTQGYDQLQAGNILGSINSYEEAYSYCYKYKLQSGFDIVEYVFKPLSNNYTRLGDYERAIYIQQKAIAASTNADNTASLYSNMAITYYTMGNYPAALDAIAAAHKMVKSPQVRLRLNNTLADILYERGQYRQAGVLINANLETQKSPNSETAYWLMGEYTTLGNINVKTNKLQSAAGNFNTALSLIDKYYPGDRLREKANIIAQLGKIERLKKHSTQAITLFNKALQLLNINTSQNQTQERNIYGEANLIEIFYEKALTYIQLKQNEIALDNMRYALLATDQIRKEFADNKTKERLQQDAKDMAETAIEIAAKLYTQTHKGKYLNLMLQIAEQTKARTLADEMQRARQQMMVNTHDTTLRRRTELERAIVYNQKQMMAEKNTAPYQKKIDALKFDLALLNKKTREYTAASINSADQILTGLPDSLHVLEFFWGTRAVYVLDIKNKAINQVTKPDNVDSLKKKLSMLINTYYQNGPDAMINSPKRFYQLSNDIYNTLFKSIRLTKGEHLCIIPDDILGYLSFDGLITGGAFQPAMSQWPYLIKSVTTTYAFSLNTLIGNREKKDIRNTFGGLFITHQNKNGKPIVAVEKEVAAITKIIKGDYRYDDDVNATSFFNVFDNSATLHISTHAYLSGSSKEPTLDLGGQKLYLFELLARKTKPQLIVLSACGTGDGLLAKGEGIISLSRGFSAIGTRATIASLWNVNDAAVSSITAAMYTHLLSGQTSGAALHNAKLNWLDTDHASNAMYAPYYWDSLILMGTDQQVCLQPSSGRMLMYSGIAALLFLAIGAIWVWKKNGWKIN